MTLDILGKANAIAFKDLKHKGTREGCHCIESRDIGAYDTCMNGCKYCYANKKPQKAFENYKYHDPDSPLLLGHLKETDTVLQGVQKTFQKSKGK
jgi:DNA repair photolyase